MKLKGTCFVVDDVVGSLAALDGAEEVGLAVVALGVAQRVDDLPRVLVGEGVEVKVGLGVGERLGHVRQTLVADVVVVELRERLHVQVLDVDVVHKVQVFYAPVKKNHRS